MSISWSKRPPLSRVAHWDRWARNGPVGSFREPDMRQMIPDRYRAGRVQVGKVQTKSETNSKADNVISATITTNVANKAVIEASKHPEEILKMAKLVSVAQTGVNRLEGLARAADATAEAEIAQMDEEIRRLAMQVRKLDREIEMAEMETGKSGSDVQTAKAETDKAKINVKAEDMKAGSAKVNTDFRNDKAVNKADTGSRKASEEVGKLDDKIKTTDKEATATHETKNTKEMKDVPATDNANKGVGNEDGVVQMADADMGMKGTDVSKIDLAIVKIDVEVRKTNEEMRSCDDAWTHEVDNALIAMVAREGQAQPVLLSTPVKVAPEEFTVKERNDICSYWTEMLDMNREKYRGLCRDVAYFGSM